MEKNPEEPTCLAILLCDDVYRDERTKKLVIVGTFNQVSSRVFPCAHQRMRVLFTLTNAKGDYDLALTIEHEKTGHEILGIKGKATLKDPLQISDFDVGIENLVLPEPGKYWVILKADGELIAQRPFLADRIVDIGATA